MSKNTRLDQVGGCTIRTCALSTCFAAAGFFDRSYLYPASVNGPWRCGGTQGLFCDYTTCCQNQGVLLRAIKCES